MSDDVTTAAPQFRLTAVPGELWSAATWQRIQLITTGAVISVSGGLLLIGLIGVTILLTPTVVGALASFSLLLLLSGRLANLHRGRVAAFVGREMPQPVPERARGWWVWLRTEFARTRQWRQLAYHLVGCLVGVTALLVVAVGWGWSLVALPAVVYASPVLGVSTWIGGVMSGAGLVVLLAAPWAVRLVAWIDAELSTRLLGTPVDEVLTERLAEVTESRAGVVDAADAERRRIERDLHDGVQQRLTSLAVQLGIAKATPDDESATRALDHAHAEVRATLADLRDFLRGLHPAVLDDRGLDAALSGLAARSPLPVDVAVDLRERPSREVEAVAYFAVSEAMTNVINHAGADRAWIEVEDGSGRLRVTVGDDGRGGADPTRGSGLRGLHQRIASIDGTLHIDSPRGGPTVLRGELPCGS